MSALVRSEADENLDGAVAEIRDLLTRFELGGKNRARDLPDPNMVFPYDKAALTNGPNCRVNCHSPLSSFTPPRR